MQNCAICSIAVIMNGKGPWYKKLEQSVRILEMVTDLFLRSEVMPSFQIDNFFFILKGLEIYTCIREAVSAWKILEAEFMMAAMRKNEHQVHPITVASSDPFSHPNAPVVNLEGVADKTDRD